MCGECGVGVAPEDESADGDDSSTECSPSVPGEGSLSAIESRQAATSSSLVSLVAPHSGEDGGGLDRADAASSCIFRLYFPSFPSTTRTKSRTQQLQTCCRCRLFTSLREASGLLSSTAQATALHMSTFFPSRAEEGGEGVCPRAGQSPKSFVHVHRYHRAITDTHMNEVPSCTCTSSCDQKRGTCTCLRQTTQARDRGDHMHDSRKRQGRGVCACKHACVTACVIKKSEGGFIDEL